MLTAALGLTLSSTASFGQSICPDPNARGEHWTVYGQTRLDPAIPHHHNPTPITGNVYGEVASLPYTVPAGKVLLIQRVSIEAHWGTVLWPWVGSLPFTDPETVIESFRGRELDEPGPNYEWHGEFYLAAGKVLNITLHPRNQPAGTSPKVQGWGLSGKLFDLADVSCD
jgi:hypothetical protein